MSRPDAAPDAAIEAMMNALYEQPDDEAARRICAERLSERGDPRGEFVRLQCAASRHGTNATLVREAELLEAHESDWLGSLVDAVCRAEWDRGFLFACTLPHPSPDWLRERAEDWRWSTVEVLELERWWEGGASARQVADFVCAPRLGALKRLGGVTLPLLEELASRGSRLEELALLPIDDGERVAARLQALPALRGLAVGIEADAEPADLGWLRESALPTRLVSLEVAGIAEQELPRWHRWLTGQAPGALREVVFSGRDAPDGWALGFSRAPAGDWSVLRYRSFAPPSSRSLRQLARAMRLLPRDTLTRLVVEPQRLRSEEIHDLEDARAHHPRLGAVETEAARRARSTHYAR